MRQLLSVLYWELRLTLTRISTWVYLLLFAGLGAMVIAVLGGLFPEAALSLGFGGRLLINSPQMLAGILSGLGMFAIPVTAALLGNAICRDFQYETYPLFFTSGVSREAYLGGRFIGAIAVNVLVLSGLALGTAVATLHPSLNRSVIDAFRIESYIRPFVLLVIPNLFITGAIFFSLAAMTRRMLPNYLGGVVLLVGYTLSDALMGELKDRKIAALLDPFGLRALDLISRYWSISEKNELQLPFDSLLLLNRAIWIVAAALLLLWTLRRFSFSHSAPESGSALLTPVATEVRPAPATIGGRIVLPASTLRADRVALLAQFAAITRSSIRSTVSSRYFLVIVFAGIGMLLITAQQLGTLYGTSIHPVTYAVEELLSATFTLFALIVIVLYSGELVWEDRSERVSQIVDALPVPNWISVTARFAALGVIIVLLQGIVLFCGVATQAAMGYYNFQMPLYLQLLLGVRLPDYLITAALAFTVHVIVNQKYVAHLVVLMLLAATIALPAIGIQHNLLLYGADGGLTYSDMNGFGPFAVPFVFWKLYWGSAAFLLMLFACLMWVRGTDNWMPQRLQRARRQLRGSLRVAAVGGAVTLTGTGAFILYNTNVLNDYSTPREQRDERARYEKTFKEFATAPQPRITAVDLRVELYPSRADASVDGHYSLVNRHEVEISTLHVRVPSDAEIRRLDSDRVSQRDVSDSVLGYYILRIEPALAPGDSMRLQFGLDFFRRGFPNDVDRLDIVRNGTMLHSMRALPGIGYSSALELMDDDARESRGLAPRAHLPAPTDTVARQNTYIGSDADWVSFNAVVGTDSDQIAVAPGSLRREWTENGRRYFQYSIDHPVLNFFAILSARYQVQREEVDGVSIEVYHHPSHAYNVSRMIASARRALQYYSSNFGPYQHRELRILEFPRYFPLAQALPGTISYSEAVGFIARIDATTDIDYPYYVTAHEVAHQWWAHQVVPGAVQGASMLTETMSQYSALMVMEKEYGATQMRRFLGFELDRYLLGRTGERRREVPLANVEYQQYIHYNKGSLVMYALRDQIGESSLNAALRRFISAYRFTPAPFPSSVELLDSIATAVPDSLQHLLEDYFRSITLYDLRVDSATTSQVDSSGWRVQLHINAAKLRADSLGRETEIPFAEWIDVDVRADTGALFARGEATLHSAKHEIRAGDQVLTLLVKGKPSRVMLDPQKKLIARSTLQSEARVVQRDSTGAGKSPGG